MKKLLLLIITFSFLSCSNSTPSDSNVKEAGRAVIINKLKDPTSVTFHNNGVVQKIADSTYLYSETINAKNSFGGSIKQNAFVTVKWRGGNPSDIPNWSIINVQFD